MRLKMRLDVELLTEEQLARLLQDALKVWKTVPFRVQATDEFYDLLSDFGCRVDGELVHFPQSVIDRVMAQASTVRGEWEEANTDAEPGWPSDELSMYTHGQALQACDLETNELRPATTADLASWCRAVDALGDVERSHPTFIPTDVPRRAADFLTFATIILNSAKPHRVSVYCANMLPYFIEAWKIAASSVEGLGEEPDFATKCWVNSPFMLTRENVDIAMSARRLLGRPVQFGNMPVAGAAGPVTLAGSLVQNTAESLGLCAMGLAIDGTLRASVAGTTTMMDMGDACHRQSGPDILLHVLAASQMRAHIFGGKPGTVFSSTAISAQTASAQSVYEKGMINSFNLAAGCRSMGIGMLACSDVGSPVQLVLDYEMGQFFRHMLRDVSTDDEHVGLDTILETAPRGAYYLETMHTARFFREECWLPAFLDSRVPGAWAQNPSDMIERARDRAGQIFSEAENQCPLSSGQREQVQALMAEAQAVADQS